MNVTVPLARRPACTRRQGALRRAQHPRRRPLASDEPASVELIVPQRKQSSDLQLTCGFVNDPLF